MPQLDFQTLGIAVVAMVIIGEKLFAFLRHMRARDDQFERRAHPELHQQFAGKEHVEKSLDKLSERLSEVAQKGENSRKDLYEQIRCVREEVASVGTQTEMMQRQMSQMDTKLDRVIEKTAGTR